jgi:hypothetical protein
MQISIATLAPCIITTGFRSLDSASDGVIRTTSVPTLHPVVSTRCWQSRYLKSEDKNHTETGNNSKIAYYQDNGTSLDILFDFRTLSNRMSGFNGTRTFSPDPTIYYPLIWDKSPEPSSNSIIAVIPYYDPYGPSDPSTDIGPKGDAGKYKRRDEPPPSVSVSQAFTQIEQGSGEMRAFACTISAYWNAGEIHLTENKGTDTVQTSALPLIPAPHNARKINLDVAKFASMQGAELYSMYNPEADSTLSVLSESLAIAISEVHVGGEDQFSQDYDGHSTTAFKYTYTVNGYGYGNKSISVWLAMAVVMVYCMVSVTYIAYILITGSTSTAWNSGIELVSLALQSRKPDHLGNSGVGIDSIKTFQEGVGIRVNRDDELELVFAHDHNIDKRGLRKLERNIEY